MSIQQSKYSAIIYRVFSKLKLLLIYDSILKVYQFTLRKLILLDPKNKSNVNVFFDYYHHYTHPFFKKRFYGKRAPLPWCNLKSSKVVHLIQSSSPRFIGND